MHFNNQIQIQIEFRGLHFTGNKWILKLQLLFFTVKYIFSLILASYLCLRALRFWNADPCPNCAKFLNLCVLPSPYKPYLNLNSLTHKLIFWKSTFAFLTSHFIIINHEKLLKTSQRIRIICTICFIIHADYIFML